MRGAIAIAAGAFLVVLPSVARADGPAEPIRIAYEADDSCPSAASFSAEVLSRSSRARAARPHEAARTLRVKIVRDGEGHVGTLTIDDGDAESTSRQMAGSTCAEVTAALAMVAALALDPVASSHASSEPVNPGEATTSGATVAAARTETPAAPDTPPKPPEILRTFASVGADGEMSGMAGAVTGVHVFGELSRTGALLSPSFRIGLTKTFGRSVPSTMGQLDLDWFEATGDACPIELALHDFTARPCLGLTAGIVNADASNVPGGTRRTRPWSSATGAFRFSWAPIHDIAAELEAGASMPFTREDFIVYPGPSNYRAPGLAFLGRAGVAVRFW